MYKEMIESGKDLDSIIFGVIGYHIAEVVLHFLRVEPRGILVFANQVLYATVTVLSKNVPRWY